MLVLLLDSCFGEAESLFLDSTGQRPENITLNHAHDDLQVGQDDSLHLLVGVEHGLEVFDRIESGGLKVMNFKVPCPPHLLSRRRN